MPVSAGDGRTIREGYLAGAVEQRVRPFHQVQSQLIDFILFTI
jgi:hypothetical protein